MLFYEVVQEFLHGVAPSLFHVSIVFYCIIYSLHCHLHHVMNSLYVSGPCRLWLPPRKGLCLLSHYLQYLHKAWKWSILSKYTLCLYPVNLEDIWDRMREPVGIEHIRNIGLCSWDYERIHLMRAFPKYHLQFTELKHVVSSTFSLRQVGLVLLEWLWQFYCSEEGVFSLSSWVGVACLKAHELLWALKYVGLAYPVFEKWTSYTHFKNLDIFCEDLNFFA